MTGPGTGGTPAGPTTGGGGGQPSVPCKTNPITPGPSSGPTTGGPRGPSDQVPPGQRSQPVWTPRGRGIGGGRGTVPGGGEQRSERSTMMPTGAAIFGFGGSHILPLSGSLGGRGDQGTRGQDVRTNLMRLSGRNPFNNEPHVISGVSERIGSATREDQQLYTLFRPMAQGFASINFRPQLTINGFPNFEHNPQMPLSMYLNDERTRPQVLTMRAWGAQSASDSDWRYVQQPSGSRARGGTGDGGILLAPPRFELSDYYGIGGDVMDVTDTTSAQATANHVLHAPGVSLSYGLPNVNGSLQLGSSSTTYGGTTQPQLTRVHTSSGTVNAWTLNYNSTGDEVVVAFGQTQAVQIPSGTTAQRPSSIAPAAGMIRFNTTNTEAEVYNGSSWSALGGVSGSLVSLGLTASAERLIGNTQIADGNLEEISLDATLEFNPSGVTLGIAGKSLGASQIADGSITDALLASGGQYHGAYNTEAETQRSGATATTEIYYTARPDGDGYAESEVDDSGLGAGESSRRRLYYSDKFDADPDTSGDWTLYTTQPADDTAFATCKASLLAGLSDTDGTANTRGTLPVSLKMERTVITPLLLDTYTGAAAAYSVRLLRTAYTGDAIRIREDSGNTETDIGFDGNGDLDTAAIASHCGANNGYVVTWYDQSGNGNDATQSTTTQQPQIYNGTATITENGKPTIEFDGSDDFLDSALTVSTTDIAVSSVQKFNSIAGNQVSITISEAISNQLYMLWNDSSNNWKLFYKSTQDVTADTNQNLIGFYTDGTSTYYYKNGATLGTAYTASSLSSGDPVRIGRWSGGGYATDLKCQELIIWQSDQSSNRSGIESNVNNYFSIY
jgi:hypothetical protein